MRTLAYVKCLTAAATIGLASLSPAQAAEDTIKFGLCYDLSKSYTFVTPQISQAAQDLATLVNMKGGIDGHNVEIIVQDHGNEPQRGIECYEKLKREGVFVFDMLSTPVSIAVLPRIMKDKNILIQSVGWQGGCGRWLGVHSDLPGWSHLFGDRQPTIIAYIKEQSGGEHEGRQGRFCLSGLPLWSGTDRNPENPCRKRGV